MKLRQVVPLSLDLVTDEMIFSGHVEITRWRTEVATRERKLKQQ